MKCMLNDVKRLSDYYKMINTEPVESATMTQDTVLKIVGNALNKRNEVIIQVQSSRGDNIHVTFVMEIIGHHL